MPSVQVRGEICPQQPVDFEGLLLTHQRHHTETGRPPEFVGLVFLLFQGRDDERSNDRGFFVVYLSFTCRALDVIGEDVRPDPNSARIPQWLDVTIVGELIAELNDLRDAAEVFHQSNGFAERLTGQIVDRGLSVVQMAVRNPLQELVDEILNNGRFLSHRGGADLLVVAHDNDVPAQVKRHQSHNITLTGFINDYGVKARFSRVKILHHPGEGHDPYGNGAPAIGHLAGGLGTQTWSAHTGALA